MIPRKATLGGGCFWCTEAVFQKVRGVTEVRSGYSGGSVPGHPTYREVVSGRTGHAEVIQLTYDPAVIGYMDILKIFMTTHDPTTLNRQGADVGTQYRSVIFYHDQEQKEAAETVIKELDPIYRDPIVTEIAPMGKFYEAEKEHQDFYRSHKGHPYCNYVIDPKLSKLRQEYADKLEQ